MKKFYLTKGKYLLLTLVALIMGGMMPVLADNADFENKLFLMDGKLLVQCSTMNVL